IAGVVIFLGLVNENMKIIELLLLASDISLYFYCVNLIWQTAFFTLEFLYQFTYLSRLVFRNLRTQIRLSLLAISVKPTVPLARHARYYFLNHHRMTRLILQLNHGLASRLIFT